MYDWVTPSKGGRGSQYCLLSRWSLFNKIRDYFPVTLVKTAQLDPTKNYIFGYHPHGMVPEGAMICFSTEAAGFQQMFPGLEPRVSMVSCKYELDYFKANLKLHLPEKVTSIKEMFNDLVMFFGGR